VATKKPVCLMRTWGIWGKSRKGCYKPVTGAMMMGRLQGTSHQMKLRVDGRTSDMSALQSRMMNTERCNDGRRKLFCMTMGLL
jgi:hypothetical protein